MDDMLSRSQWHTRVWEWIRIRGPLIVFSTCDVCGGRGYNVTMTLFPEKNSLVTPPKHLGITKIWKGRGRKAINMPHLLINGVEVVYPHVKNCCM